MKEHGRAQPGRQRHVSNLYAIGCEEPFRDGLVAPDRSPSATAL